jgi:hypothetical protein
MASSPVSGLTSLTTALASHVLHISVGTSSGDDRKITFTNFMDSIRVATTSVKGFLSAADKSKLDGIEAAADVTDATNVAAAGAVMDSDIAEAEGMLRKTGVGAYQAIKSNLGASADPTAEDNGDQGYAVGSLWINTTADKVWQCVDATGGSPSVAVWRELSAGGGLNNVVEDTTPQLGGELDAQGNAITDHAIKAQTVANNDWNGAKSFDYAAGPVIKATRENSCTPSITNWPAAGEAKVTFELAYGAGSPSGAPVTWTSVVDKWLGGSTPTLGSTAGDVDLIVVTTTDGGTTVLGVHIGTYS